MDHAAARSPTVYPFSERRRRRSSNRECQHSAHLRRVASADSSSRGARDWDEPRLRAVLLHEAAHVARRDCLAKYVAQASRALLWWNPLAWMMAARLDHEQELACDDAVLSAGISADAYAKALLDVARECSSSLLLGCAMNASSTLHERLAHLFEWRRKLGVSTRRIAITIPLLLVLMTTASRSPRRSTRLDPASCRQRSCEKTEPQYTDEAKAAKIEGTVQLIDRRRHGSACARHQGHQIAGSRLRRQCHRQHSGRGDFKPGTEGRQSSAGAS